MSFALYFVAGGIIAYGLLLLIIALCQVSAWADRMVDRALGESEAQDRVRPHGSVGEVVPFRREGQS